MFNSIQKQAMGKMIRYEKSYYLIIHMVKGNSLKPAFKVVAKLIEGLPEAPQAITIDSRFIGRSKYRVKY